MSRWRAIPAGHDATALSPTFHGPLCGFADLKDTIVRAIDEAKREGRL